MNDRALYDHKITQLEEMLKWEEAKPPEEQYGAHVTHWSGHGLPVNIDAGALRLLIEYYRGKSKEETV